jgi:hypothetical protein
LECLSISGRIEFPFRWGCASKVISILQAVDARWLSDCDSYCDLAGLQASIRTIELPGPACRSRRPFSYFNKGKQTFVLVSLRTASMNLSATKVLRIGASAPIVARSRLLSLGPRIPLAWICPTRDAQKEGSGANFPDPHIM